MTISELGSLGELIAAIATIATLIYLARQIRHNTGQLQAEAIVAINDAERALVSELRNDPELLRTWVKATSDWGAATAGEQASAHLYLHAYARWCETCWLLWTRGALDDVTYASRAAMTTMLLRSAGARTWWGMVKVAFDPRFVAHVEKRLEEEGDEALSILDLPFYAPRHWVDDAEA